LVEDNGDSEVQIFAVSLNGANIVYLRRSKVRRYEAYLSKMTGHSS